MKFIFYNLQRNFVCYNNTFIEPLIDSHTALIDSHTTLIDSQTTLIDSQTTLIEYKTFDNIA